MNILYDYQIFSIQKFGGISRYFCELIKNFPAEHNYKLAVLFSENHYLKENYELIKKRDILPDREFKGKHFLRKNLNSINQHYSKHLISSNKFDLLHPTYYNKYFISVLKKPYIITVHDLIALKYRDSFFKSHYIIPHMEYVIKNANRIISISENTKKDLIEILDIDPGKIDVIYHGYNNAGLNKKIAGVENKYILFVGLRNRYKNFKTFAKSIGNLFIREKHLKLVCVGEPFSNEELTYLSNLKILDRTIVMNADDNKLNELYSNALMFVYPSLYEGFGMPILEAFANNCPVCLSNSSCFPEIAGKAGEYFDPDSQQSILSSIEKVLYDSSYADELVLEGQNRLKMFSWSKTILETFNSYNKAI
jgi:glycosyltransferase involved in cell wall biosynthesis